MQHVTSQDGTVIAFDQVDQGSAVILVGGVLGGHTQQAPLAQLLASHFTVYNLDRRGMARVGIRPRIWRCGSHRICYFRKDTRRNYVIPGLYR